MFTKGIIISLQIQPNQYANKTLATQMINKTLDQVNLQHGINFDKVIPIPPLLSYQKGKIKFTILFCTFMSESDIKTWSELPSKTKRTHKKSVDGYQNHAGRPSTQHCCFMTKVIMSSQLICLIPLRHSKPV